MTADPTLGSPASIRTAARHHASVATTTEDARARLSSAAADLDPSDWTGVARDRFSSAVTALLPALARTVALSEHVADTLDDYADAVERIQDEAARVRSAQQTAADERRRLASEQRDLTARTDSDDAVESDAVRLRRVGQDLTQQDDTLAQLSARWDELVAERERLDRQTAADLDGVESVGVTAVTARSVSLMTDAEFLTWLSALTPDEIRALGSDQTIADRLAAMDDPEQVAAWWEAAGGDSGRGSADDFSVTQDALVAAFPAVLGNLNGVAYWARDRANRSELQRLIRGAHGDDLQAYKNIRASLGKYEGVQLLTLVPQHPPLAAVSIGDLDTAPNVTYVVPGMDSDTRNMTVVERAAYNLRTRQRNYTESVATVAWINYETPTTSTVLHGDLARAGAVRLGEDLAGFNASRGATKGTLNVVGHSYGSTTSSITVASHDYGVDNYVVAGSAGVEHDIRTAADIKADHVFAAQAPRTVQPFPGDNWSWVGQAFSMTRRDPASPSFGATWLPTAGVPGDPSLNGVNRHDPVWNNSTDRADQYGYFDTNTESLDNIARATTGQGDFR